MIKWFFAGAGAALAAIFIPAGISTAKQMRREQLIARAENEDLAHSLHFQSQVDRRS